MCDHAVVRLVVVVLSVCFVTASAMGQAVADHRRQSLPANELLVFATPVSLSWYVGHHAGFADDDVKHTTMFVAAGGAAWVFNDSLYELRPQVEYVNPLTDEAPWGLRSGLNALVWTDRGRAVAAGVGMYLGVSRYELLGQATWTTGASLVLALRVRLSPQAALRVELSGGLDFDAQESSAYDQDVLHFARLSIGISHGL